MLLLEEKVLVIAVTYNCKSSLSDGLDSWGGIEDERIFYALSMVARMASVFYGLSFGDTVKLMKSCLSSFHPLARRKSGEDLLRTFVLRMADEVTASGRTIDTFILLIDEAMAMEVFIEEKFKKDRITSCVRNAMLSEDLKLHDGRAVNLGLAISSLSIDSFGITFSGRDVVPIILASKLDKTKVVTEIWRVGSKSHVSPEVLHRLELMAATVHQLPRLVEMTKDIVTDDFLLAIINPTLVKAVYHDLFVKASNKYKTSLSLPNSLYSAIIFQDAIRLDDEGAKMAIISSVITNSLSYVGSKEAVKSPETSLMMLWISASKGGSAFAVAIASGIDTIVNSIAVFHPKGKLWETCYYEWMKIRIQAARASDSDKRMSIAKLLGIENNDIIPPPHRSLFIAPLHLYNLDVKEINLPCNSYNDPNRVRSEIDINATVCEEIPVVIIIPAEGEAWDLCLKIFAGEGKKPMHVFIENKSAEVTSNSTRMPDETWKEIRAKRIENIERDNMTIKCARNDTVSIYDLFKYGKQYMHTKEMMESRDFVYIYFKTHNVESFRVENAIEMGRSDSMRYLGPLYELYKVGRSTSSEIDLDSAK